MFVQVQLKHWKFQPLCSDPELQTVAEFMHILTAYSPKISSYLAFSLVEIQYLDLLSVKLSGLLGFVIAELFCHF